MRKYYYLKEKEEAQKEQHPEIQVESWNVNEPERADTHRLKSPRNCRF